MKHLSVFRNSPLGNMRTQKILKIFFCTIVSLFSFNSYSQKTPIEFSLKCKVKVDYYYDGAAYRQSENAEVIVEVSEYPNRKSLSLKSANIDVNNITVEAPAVETKYYERLSLDSSDENKYEITSYTTSRLFNSTNMIYLNRNNGQIIVTSEFARTGKGVNQTSVNGNCDKIDLKKKKF